MMRRTTLMIPTRGTRKTKRSKRPRPTPFVQSATALASFPKTTYAKLATGKAPSVSKEVTITPDGKAVVTVTTRIGGGQMYFRPMLGTCGPICGKAGHEDNEKPHVR